MAKTTNKTISKSTKKKIKKNLKKVTKKQVLVIFILLLIVAVAFIALYSMGYLDAFLKPAPEDPTTEEPTTEEHTHEQNEAISGVVYDDLQIHFIELGNRYTGDSTYIKAGEVDILIDAGSRKNSATEIKAYVDEYCTDGVLEYVIATHAHQDHIAGFVGSKSGNTRTGIFYQYEIETLIDFTFSDATSTLYTKEYIEARNYLIDNGTTHYTAKECYEETNGAKRVFELTSDINLEILWNKYYFEKAKDENDYSVCTMINYNDHHFMFTGDLELEGEEAMAEYYDGSTELKTLPHVDLFKAGHHGSKTSSNECLLSKITPDIVCVCCCAGDTEYTIYNNNIFPTQDFINRVAKYTDQVYATTVFNEKTMTFESLNGDIIVSCDGENVAVAASNNTTKLKDSTWFNEIIYVDSNGKIGPDDDEFYTKDSEGVTAVPRRVWPTN